MTHAYNESYLNNAKNRLATYFDYMKNAYDQGPERASELFVVTGYAEQFERGNPAIIAGMSGVELARAVILKAYNENPTAERVISEECSPEFWAGWAIAEYQWVMGRRFKDIWERVSMSEVVDMYSVYHEMDITSFVKDINNKYDSVILDTKLKRIRENRGISQAELAADSGVKLRSIQMYEQRVNDIDKAQAGTLYKLSRVLGCNVEDLLES